MYSIKFLAPELLREKLENVLEISGKTQRIYFFLNVATLLESHMKISLRIVNALLKIICYLCAFFPLSTGSVEFTEAVFLL